MCIIIRKFVFLLLVMAIVLLSASSVGAETMQGKLVQGRFLVPMRPIFEALGAGVDWDGDTRTVTGIKGTFFVPGYDEWFIFF